MLKEYSISHLLNLPNQHIPYYAGTFEGTEDPDLEWPHRHSFYSIVWFTGGSGFYVIDSNEYQIQPGRAFLVNPKQIHNWDYSEKSKGYILIIDNTLGIELGLDFQYPFINISPSKALFLKPIVKNLISAYKAGYDITIDIRYVYKVLERIACERKTIKSESNPVFDKFRSLILNNAEINWSVEDYAARLTIPISVLNAISKQVIGISAKQYLLDLKVTEAKRFLLYTDLNVNEISFRLGFEDASYFSRIFKKKTSLSPTDFSEKYRK